ncbi:hypothetical protein ACI65C_004205 [Semiaphis heraclei]
MLFFSTVQSVLLLHPDCVFIFCGDFNLPDIKWSNDDFGLLYNSISNPRIPCIPEAFAIYNLFQLNDIQNSFGGILDLVLSNDKRVYVIKAEISAVLCDPYHPALDIMSMFHHYLMNSSGFLCHDLSSTCSFSINDIDDGLNALNNVSFEDF